MPTTPTVTGPVSMRMHKKVGTDDYILYHPQTGDTEVLIGTTQWEGSGFIPAALYNVNGGTVTTNMPTASWVIANKGSHPYVKLSEYLKYINDQIKNFGGVIEFSGAKTYSTLPTTTDPSPVEKGEVFLLTEQVSWRSGTSGDWKTYAANTLFLYTGENTGYVNTSSSTGNGKGPGWYPLGGSNDLYALKSQALSTASLSGSTLIFGYADDTSTHTLSVPFNSIGTVTAGTTTIATEIPASGSNNAIPTVEAVRNYASSAGQVTVTTVTNGNLIVVPGNTDGTKSVGVVNIAVTGGQDSKPILSANINGTAGSVANNLVIQGLDSTGSLATAVNYNGSFTRGIKFLDGLVVNYDGANATEEVKVKAGDGITVTSANGVAVKADTTKGITTSTSGVGIAISHGLEFNVSGQLTVKPYVTHGISVGASGVDINLGQGLEYGTNSIKAKADTANGVKLGSNGIGVNVDGNNITHSNNAINLKATGIAAGVYSALSVDTYGRASAGAQSLVFAENISDPDLNSLVVGGLAFVGTAATSSDDTYPTHSGTLNPIG